MESEKVNEILGRLHCKLLGDRKNEINPEEINCVGEVITLINELESENERLNECYKVKAYDKLRADNHKLKDRIAELETKNEVLCVELSRYTENCIEMKNCTLKQFAEKVKELFVEEDEVRDEIDVLVKQFIGKPKE